MSHSSARLFGTVLLIPALSLAATATTTFAAQAADGQAAPAQAAPATPAPTTAADTTAAPGLTAKDAAPFVGDWTVQAQGPQGPAVFNISVHTDGDKVIVEVSSDVQPKMQIADVSKQDTSLVLRYSIDYQGMDVPTEIDLTPNADKLDVNFSFMDGQYTMTGTGTKKA